MNNKAKSAVLLTVLSGLIGCNKSSGIVDRTEATVPEVKVKETPIQRIVYANNALADSWFSNDNKTATMDSRSILSEMMAKNVYLILDASSTTTQSSCFGYGSKQQVMEAAVFNFVDEMPENTNLGVIRFDSDGPNEIASLAPVDVTFLKQLMSETKAGGGNPVAITISYAYKALQRQAMTQNGYGEYHIVLLTDGGIDNSNELRAATRTITESSPVVLHTYDFCPSSYNELSSMANVDYKPLLNDENLRNAILGTFPIISMTYEAPFEKGENVSVGNVDVDIVGQDITTDADVIEPLGDATTVQSAEFDSEDVQNSVITAEKSEHQLVDAK